MIYKKKAKKILVLYERQINRDIGFWIKYRPSRWSYYLPDKLIRPWRKFVEKEGGKKFVLIVALISSLIIFGFISTLNLIWSNVFRVSLMLLLIPLFYWALVIICVYTRAIALVFREFILVILKSL